MTDGGLSGWQSKQFSRMGAPPATIRRVEQHLESPRGLVDLRYDSRKYHHFLSKEGKVEFAIDALINVTRNVAVDGDDGWEYGIFDQIESLPATHTPFDDAFDIARFKCINQGGGEGTMRGPYQNASDQSMDEGSMDGGDY